MKTDQQKVFGWGEHMPRFVKNLANFYHPDIWKLKGILDVKLTDTIKVAPQKDACGLFFFSLWTIIAVFSSKLSGKTIKKIRNSQFLKN